MLAVSTVPAGRTTEGHERHGGETERRWPDPTGVPASGGRRPGSRRPVWLGLVIGAIAALVGVTTWASRPVAGPHPSAPVSPRSPTAHPGTSGLPVLGNSAAFETSDEALNDVGDPYIVPVPGGAAGSSVPTYVLYWTTDWASNVPTAVSTDLVHWRRVADSLPVLPSWAHVVRPPRWWSSPTGVSTMTWGPSVEPMAGGWMMYYSTEDTASGLECIGDAFSTSPTGPFVDSSTAPLVCQTALGGDIDPSVVSTGPGRYALVWKNDGNAVGAPVGIWEQSLTSDGRSTSGSAVPLIGADQAWEHGIIEGPAMLADTKGGWWLFYSGGTWQSDTYDTGVAWCATVSGPCTKPAQEPLLASVPTAVSPGGLDTFVGFDGTLRASYSAFPTQPADARAAMASPRVLEIAPILSH
ncbi:MAG: glycoside hydrolase family 43 protein [Acidimicrobiales bacterium]